MKRDGRDHGSATGAGRRLVLLLALLLGVGMAASGQNFTVNVVDEAGLPVPAYRWLLQEDTTYDIKPGMPVADFLAYGFHTSYSPPVATGTEADGLITVPDPAKRYYLSVLPRKVLATDQGYTMSGAPIPVGVSGAVTVKVHTHPIPTAQISVFVFEDTNPINNIPDQPQETGLAGFKIVLEDAGGRYGMSAGAQMMDAFGNPLGTVYSADGTVVKMGDGVITTDANGLALIQNLSPGKYGVSVVPPAGQGWMQTSTIEGTKINDAWVKAGEPPFFVEFGPPGYHAFFGFVRPMKDPTFFTGTAQITGRVVNLHNARPPQFQFSPGHPIPSALIALNSGPAGTGRGVYVAPANEDSTFTISNVPVGTYELAIWDENLDLIWSARNVTITTAGEVLALGDVPVFNWFARLESYVFEDLDQDGFRDANEKGIPEQAVNIRFRDGSMYQSAPTDLEGYVPFDEVFPFFNWLVAEVDYTRLKATGATVIVDAGGPVLPDMGWEYPSRGVLTPQPQLNPDGSPAININTGNNLSRTETGPVLLEAFQAFMGTTNIIEWGKAPYAAGENGGISGIVYYASTRAENDPALAVGEPWEPGIPRVQVNLYRDTLGDGIIDDLDGDGVEYADVDSWPLGWADGTGSFGPEDVDHNGNGTFDLGDALQAVWSDSWDDSTPTGAQGSNGPGFEGLDAFDGLRNFNQVRPGVFDGGYAFTGIPAGIYIVEAKAPVGYEFVKEEDKNVDFGDEYQGVTVGAEGTPVMPMGPPDNPPPTMDPLDKRPVLVGDPHLVPAELTLFPGVPAPFAGQLRPLPDRKQVKLVDGQNAAADFFLFTYVPVAGHIVGFVLDDTANEFDPNAPTFGEKHAPAFLPISVRDWVGNVIAYGSTDGYGAYNILVPSTYTANIPAPSGYSPNMLTVIINDPTHPTITHNPVYSQFSYTFQYMPGTTTYLDTPVLPVAAFAGPGQFPVDVEFEDGTPVVSQVDGGPYVAAPGQQITIRSLGTAVVVPNPDWDGTAATPQTITRDYGFGTSGVVTIDGIPLTIVSWAPDAITGTVAAGTTTGQLVVRRNDTGRSSILGITVTVGPLGLGPTGIQRNVINVPTGGSIQAAVEAANPGDLVLVAPGTYEELVILTKPVQLQGWGAGVTFIDAVQAPAEKMQNWRDNIQRLWTAGAFDLLPAQTVLFTGIEPALAAVEGAGVSVFAREVFPEQGGFGRNPNARIDGFTIVGASTGGGVFVNGYARYLEVSNNRIRLNAGAQGGGITIGHPTLVLQTPAGLVNQDAHNDNVRIHNNQITGNGSLGGAGGGVALYTGAHGYQVTDNLIAGNFAQTDGGGIGHLGKSEGGTIARNRVVFNQSFYQQTTVSGGGIFVGGEAALTLGGLTEGSGRVTIDANLIQGNLAGAGDGGGIDVLRTLPADRVLISNNFIVNNVAGLAGGGVALKDAVNVAIVHNTIARNDSTATAGEAFLAANESTPQPGGLAVRGYGPEFQALTGVPFTAPQLSGNIIWENRSFSFTTISAAPPFVFGLLPSPTAQTLVDAAVLPASAGTLSTAGNLVTGAAVPFLAPYVNVAGQPVVVFPETTIIALPAFDEGGNFIDVRYKPLSTAGSNYHLGSALAGGSTGLTDADGDLGGGTPWYGADRYVASTNAAPVAVNDAYAIALGNAGNPPPLSVAAPGLLANDFDPDGTPLSVVATLVTAPINGTVTLGANGSFTYTANRRFEGVDSFSYLASDGSRASVGTVVITVSLKPANSPPVPTALPIDTTINTPGTTRVLPNDPDVGDTHTYSISGNPRHGTAVVSASGTVTYTPDLNYAGTDDVSVRVRDQGNRQGFVTILVTVSLNLPPSQDVRVQMPPDTDGIDTDGDGNPANDSVYLLLGAGDGFSTMADGYPQYGFGFSNLSHLLPPVAAGDPAVRTIPMDTIMMDGMLAAEYPAPTIKVREGQKVYLNLFNVGMTLRPDLFDPHSVHWHGFPQASSVFDGVPDASLSINMGGTFTYFYFVTEAGTYLYHCHVEATEHMQMGMLGNLYVLPMQDLSAASYPKADGTLYKGFAYNDGDGSTGYDLDVPLQLAGFDSRFHDASLNVQPLGFAQMKDNYALINGRGYPDTTAIGSLPPAMANTVVMSAAVAAAPAPNVNRFYVTGAELALKTGAYDGMDLVFTSGALTGTRVMIKTYRYTKQGQNVRLEIVPAMPLAAAPAAGSTFAIGTASQNLSSRIVARAGQRVLLRISNVSVTRFYTLASTLPMEVVGLNARLLRGPDPDGAGALVGKNLYYTTNSVTLGGGEALDAIVDLTGVAPGTYLLYTTNLNYLSNNQEDFGGMMTELVVTP